MVGCVVQEECRKSAERVQEKVQKQYTKGRVHRKSACVEGTEEQLETPVQRAVSNHLSTLREKHLERSV